MYIYIYVYTYIYNIYNIYTHNNHNIHSIPMISPEPSSDGESRSPGGHGAPGRRPREAPPGRRGRLRNGRLCHVEGKLEEFLGHGAHGAMANDSGGILSIYIYLFTVYIYIYSKYIYIYTVNIYIYIYSIYIYIQYIYIIDR